MRYKIKKECKLSYFYADEGFTNDVFYNVIRDERHLDGTVLLKGSKKQNFWFHIKDLINEKDEHYNKFNAKIDDILK